MIDDEYETEEQIQKQVRFAINMEDYYEIVIKYQDKEKVITRDDFVDSNKMVGSQYIKGSRMWAFEMLNKGKKIRNIKWEDLNIKGYIYIDEEDELMTENDSSCTEISYFKDGWELYKEPKKTMIFAEMLETQGDCKFKFVYEETKINVCGIWERNCGEVLLRKEGKPTEKMSLAYIARLSQKQVEIIE